MSKWDQNIHEQSDKILMPPKPLMPHIGNWPQNPKITPTWFWKHVKGKQDGQTGTLDRWSTLNVGIKKEGK